MCSSLAFLFWLLFPNGPLGITVLFVSPLMFTFILAAVWPKKKGQLWPYGDRPFTRGVFLQNWIALGLGLTAFMDSAVFLYSGLFPNPYWPVHLSWLIPNLDLIQTFTLLTIITGILFFFQFWRFVRMLPPKSSDSS